MPILQLIFLISLFLSSLLLNAQDLSYAREMIDTLSSPAFHGRGYVLKGDSLAAAFIKDQYQEIGLKAVNNSYFQRFTHSVNTLNGDLALYYNNKELKPGAGYLADPASSAGKGKGELIALTPEEILHDKWVDKVRKKNVLSVDLTKTDSLSNEEKKRVFEFVEYLKFEEDIASKVIVLKTKGKIPWSVSNKQAFRPVFTIFTDSLEQTDEEEIKYKVDAKWIENYQSKNVIGFVPGSSDSDSLIVITAHYDHLGMMGLETYFPGANDNASGVALMLNLAREIHANPLPYDTYFIAFAGEEAGLKGSINFVMNPLFPLEKVKFLLNLDLAGTGNDGIMAVNGKIYEEQFNTLKNLNNYCECMPAVKARGEACNSDHCPFHMRGVPSFFIYTLGGTKYYHDIYDKAETLDLQYYEAYFSLLKSFLRAQ